MSLTTPTPSDAAKVQVNEAKWTKPLWSAGWSGVPSIIIEKQAALGLDALDMNIILHLTQYWWQKDNPPCPSVPTIAKALQVTDRTIQKRIKALEDLGLIERVERRQTKHGSDTNLYKLDGLIAAATPFAEEKLAEIEKAKAARKERLQRKKPKLSLVKS